MEGSRLSRFGKETLKNRNQFNLLQQIDNQQDYLPIINYTTTYLNENGEEISINQNNIIEKSETFNEIPKQEENQLYSLPKKQYKGFSSQSQMQEQSPFDKYNKSELLEKKPKRKGSSKSGFNDEILETMNRSNKKLLDIKKPLRRKKDKWDPNFDIPNSDLFQIEDIIQEITSVVDKSKRAAVIAPSKEKPESNKKQKFKGFKSNWNANNNMTNKLDQMLLGYKTVGKDEEQQKIPIMDDFYREKKNDEDEKEEDEQKKEKKFTNFIKKFEEKKKPKNGNTRLSILQIKWEQLPIVPAQWDSNIYLRLQSYPQQEQYLKVVKKAIQNRVKTYSIFTSDNVGIKKDQKNDKNVGSWKLMSEEEYAKEWESMLHNGGALEQSQIQTLMQFDIEWYRAIIEYEYRSGLQDILEKQYDIEKYSKLLKSIKRCETIEIDLLIQNQVRYLQQYFKDVYSAEKDQILVGATRLSNQNNILSDQIADTFKNNFVGHTCIFPFTESSFVVINQFCGSASSISLKEQEQKFTIKVKKPQLDLSVGAKDENLGEEQNMILLKEGQDNHWELSMKVIGQDSIINNTTIKVEEQLLFGMLYSVDFSNEL